MKISTRISLCYSLLVVLLLTVFSWAVFTRVKRNVIRTADRTLVSHLDHDAEHLGHAHDGVHGRRSSQADGVYLKVRVDGLVVEDSFPVGIDEERLSEGRGDRHIVRRIRLERDGRRYEVTGYYDLTSIQGYLADLRRILMLCCAMSILVIAPVGFFVTRMLLAPFRELAEKTSAVDARDLSRRFAVPPRIDEYGVLVRNFNSLLERLDNSFGRVKRFAAQASHELRTPLAVIISQTEMALRRPRTVEEHREVAEKALAQAKHLREITNRLLSLADIERARTENAQALFKVDAVLRDVLDTIGAAYRSEPRQVSVHGPLEELCHRGSRDVFQTILSNLLENAYKYSRAAVAISVEAASSELRFRVEDDGPGIPLEQRELAFEAFAPIRTRADGPLRSHGLGLSIVHACVEAEGGHISLGDSKKGGLKVDVVLPVRGSTG